MANSEERELIAMELFSEALLRALWREHPRILRKAQRDGRKVVGV